MTGPAKSEWLPIETAPKDGTHILIGDFSGTGAGFGWYEGVRVAWQAIAHWWGHEGEEGFYLSTGASGDSDVPMKATHWMSLPEGPKQ